MIVLNLVRIAIDFFCFFILLFLSVASISGLTCPSLTINGFFCDDETIRYPYKEQPVIHKLLMIFLIFLLPIVIIAILEIAANYYFPTLEQDENETFQLFVLGEEIPLSVLDSLLRIIAFIIGFAITLYFTNILKFVTGRLRPYFLDVCQPDVNILNLCNTTYVENYECSDINLDLVLKARLSFPSEYSSLSMYSSVYLTFYFHYQLMWNIGFILKYILQSVLIIVSFHVGLTQISEYQHHWSDIFTGYLLGLGVAVVVCYFLLLPQKGFEKNESVEADSKNHQ